MPKSLQTYLADVERLLPNELVRITETVDPANYDCTAIVKHLDALKKFPVVVFERPLDYHGKPGPVRLVLNAEISLGKARVALGAPFSSTRAQLVEECLRREAASIPPIVVPPDEAPIKENVRAGDEASLYDLPLMRHHEHDSGPYFLMTTASRYRGSDVYNVSFHRMEVKAPRLASWLATPRAAWEVFKDYEDHGEECPVATVLGHHPAFNMGASYRGFSDNSDYALIGAYLQEPLRVTPSTVWGERLMVPADAEVVIEGALLPQRRLSDGPFGEAAGYLGPWRDEAILHYDVRAITYRNDAIAQSIITPEGEKPWLELPGEAGYLRRAREVVPTVTAVCKSGRHAYFNVFVSMRKVREGDPGRVAAAMLAFDQTKNVFVFDEDVDVYNPAEMFWALATRVQPHRQVQIIQDLMRGSWLDPSSADLAADGRTSCMIVDATRPLGRPSSPVSKCPDEALERIRLDRYIPQEVLDHLPIDHTSYWG
jgi:UbiD family decarboxylase